MKMRNAVVVSVVFVAATLGITHVSSRLGICTRGRELDFPLCAKEEHRRKQRIGRIPGSAFRF